MSTETTSQTHSRATWDAINESDRLWKFHQTAVLQLNDYLSATRRRCDQDASFVPGDTFMENYLELAREVAAAYAAYAVAAGKVYRVRRQ